MYKKSIIRGAVILTAANLITRIMGFFYRVYMSDAIGSEGMGLYQLVMPIYLLSWSVTSSGFSTAVSRITAANAAKRRFADTEKTIASAAALCISVSLAAAALMFFFADKAALYILGDERTAISLKILSFAIPFMSVGSCVRGYFFGGQRQSVPAASQVLEQSVRIISIIVLAPLLASKGLEYACAAAVTGVLLGEAFSCVFTLISYWFMKPDPSLGRKPDMSGFKCTVLVLSMAAPLAATRVSSSLLSAWENILIPQKLRAFGETAEAAMSLYGNLTGMALPLIQLPSALLMAVATAIMPTVAESAALGDKRRISSAASRALKFTVLIGIGTASLFAALHGETANAVYGREDIGVLLLKLVPVCPLLYINIIMNGILNGLGEHLFIFRNSVISSVINIAFIYFLMPVWGINAYIAGLFSGLAFSSLSSVHRARQTADIKTDPVSLVLKPIVCAAASGLLAKYFIGFMDPSKLSYIISAIGMLAVYVLLLIACGSLDKRDFKCLKC